MFLKLVSSCTGAAVRVPQEYASVQQQSQHFLLHQTFIWNKRYNYANGDMGYCQKIPKIIVHHIKKQMRLHLLLQSEVKNPLTL